MKKLQATTGGDLELTAQPRMPRQWPQLIANVDDADFFLGELWTRATSSHFPDTTAVWIVARRGDELLGALPAVARRRHGLVHLLSNIEGTSGGPVVDPELSATEQAEICRLLIGTFGDLVHGRTVSAFVSLNAGGENRFGPVIEGLGWQREPVLGAVVPLAGGIDHVEQNVLSNNRRNERNRSLKRGCVARVTNDPDLLEQYYPIYLSMTRHWGIEPTPLPFLQQLLTEAPEQAFLVYVSYEDEVIGGYVNFHTGNRVIAWNGATMPEHNKHLFPATLVNWETIVEACRRGAEWFDLGGSAGISSLSRFKKLMGAEPEIRGQYTRVSRWFSLLQQGRNLLRGNRDNT